MDFARTTALVLLPLVGACSAGDGGSNETETETDGPVSGGDTVVDVPLTQGDPTETAGPVSGSGDTTGGTADPDTGSTDESGDPPTTDDETTDDSDGPRIPEVQGECPEFTLGVVDAPAQLSFPVGSGTRDALVWHDPSAGGGGPLVFNFHGSGGDPIQAEATVSRDAIEDILQRGGMVIAPISDPAAGSLEWYLASSGAQNDLVMMDSMVACAATDADIDPYRIHTMGFSAGGLHAAISSVRRSSYVASTIVYSGGVYNTAGPEVADAAPSTLAFHGGPADEVSGLPFQASTELYAEVVRDNGAYAIVCNHGTGHGYPDNVDGVWRRRDAYNFLLDHPWGVDPHPYPPAGIPGWVPPYCSDQP